MVSGCASKNLEKLMERRKQKVAGKRKGSKKMNNVAQVKFLNCAKIRRL